MTSRSIRSAVLMMLFALAACGPLRDPTTTASKILGTEGGQISTLSGVSISFPSGALRQSTTITIEPAAENQPFPTAPAVGDMYAFEPEGLAFDVPVTVKLAVNLQELPVGYSISDVVIQHAPVGTSAFEKLATRVVDADHVEAKTLHFSVFVPTITGTGGTDAGFDGGCSETCSGPRDGGADCECALSCGAESLEIQCSGESDLGCACVRNGAQVGYVFAAYCPALGDVETLCGNRRDAGVLDAGSDIDGGYKPSLDGGRPDAGFDGGRPDAGFDGGRPDAGFDGGRPDAGFDGGRPDAGFDSGRPDAGFDGGRPDAGFDGGRPDAGFDGGRPDAGFDGDGGQPDAGPHVDGGEAPDAGSPDDLSDAG